MDYKQNNKEDLPVFYSVWEDAWNAITKPRMYVKWALQPFWCSVKYLMIVNALVSLVFTVFLAINVKPAINEFVITVQDSVPDITMRQGTLSLENDETFIFSDSDETFIKIDVTESIKDYQHIDAFYETGVLVLKDGIYVRDGQNVETYDFEEMKIPDFTINRENVDKLAGTVMITFVVAFPLLYFLWLMSSKLLYALFFAVLVFCVSGFKLNMQHLWSMAIYALTPAILVWYIAFMFFGTIGISTLVYIAYLVLAVNQYKRFINFTKKIR